MTMIDNGDDEGDVDDDRQDVFNLNGLLVSWFHGFK
jgi:hypothetical protein